METLAALTSTSTSAMTSKVAPIGQNYQAALHEMRHDSRSFLSLSTYHGSLWCYSNRYPYLLYASSCKFLQAIDAIKAKILLPAHFFSAIQKNEQPDRGFTSRNEYAIIHLARVCSSAGRARQSHCRGQGFEPPHLHHRSIDLECFFGIFFTICAFSLVENAIYSDEQE